MKMNNYKIVKFNDGTYGVRRGLIFYSFASKMYNWYSDPGNICDYCKFNSREDAEKVLSTLLVTYEVV
jgi:hypothetical protein